MFHLIDQLPEILEEPIQKRLFQELKCENPEARQKLIEHNLRLVKSIVLKKYYNTPFEIEELFSVGTIGLIKAVDHFDFNKNIRFDTFAYHCIENEILLFLRRIPRLVREMSYEESIGNQQSHSFLEYMETKEMSILDCYTEKETLEELEDAILKVPERKREMLLMHLGWNPEGRSYSYREIAVYYQIGLSCVGKYVRQALAMVKKEYMLKNKDLNRTKNHMKIKK